MTTTATETARWMQQCWSDRDGCRGSFLLDSAGMQLTPTFTDSVKFLAFIRRHGWRPESNSLQSPYVRAAESEPIRVVVIVAERDGSIRPFFDGVEGFTYQDWRHFFACGIGSFADTDMIRIVPGLRA